MMEETKPDEVLRIEPMKILAATLPLGESSIVLDRADVKRTS